MSSDISNSNQLNIVVRYSPTNLLPDNSVARLLRLSRRPQFLKDMSGPPLTVRLKGSRERQKSEECRRQNQHRKEHPPIRSEDAILLHNTQHISPASHWFTYA